MKKQKVVAIACSPNKGGNSDTLLDEFLSTFNSNKFEVGKFYLHDIPQNFCDHGHKGEPLEEDEPDFKKCCKAIEEADGILIATPTYNFNVPASLKNLIDRIGYFSLDYQHLNKLGQPMGRLGDKKVFAIVTGGTPNWIKHFLFIIFPGFWLRIIFAYYGCYGFKTAYGGGLTYRSPAKDKPKVLAKFKKIGEKFLKKL